MLNGIRLILSSGGMGALEAEGAQILADFLQSQATSVVCLTLDCNELGDEGVSILMEPFSACRNSLELLSLNTNEIEDGGAAALVHTSFPNLKHLSLDDNMDVPKAPLRSRFGTAVYFGEDDDEEDQDAEVDDGMKFLIERVNAASL